MGQCIGCCKRPEQDHVKKQDKNIDDKRMLKVGIDVLNRDFCFQIGYNRRAVKTYGQGPPVENLKVEEVAQPEPLDANVVHNQIGYETLRT